MLAGILSAISDYRSNTNMYTLLACYLTMTRQKSMVSIDGMAEPFQKHPRPRARAHACMRRLLAWALLPS